MDKKTFNFRDITAGYVIQSFLLSCISEAVNNNGNIDEAIDKFYKEFENMGATKSIINNLIFNTTTMIWALYFCVCLAKEKTEISKYNLKNFTLEQVAHIKGKYCTMDMDEFSRILRNAIAHMDFECYEDGSINIFNSERVEIENLEIYPGQDIKQLINFANCSSKYVVVAEKVNGKMYLIKKKYRKTFNQTFTFEEMKYIVNFYNTQYIFNILGKK